MTNTDVSPVSRVTQSHERSSLDAASWPIATGTLALPAVDELGRSAQLSGPASWNPALESIRDEGFSTLEITDSWIRPGDLTPRELEDLAGAAGSMQISAVALIRRSVLDARDADANLAYSHRSIDAAAALGARVVSVGLHEALLPAQRRALWFWTESGARNDPDNADLWASAVQRFRELGRHAADNGLLLSLEMYEDTFLGTAESAVRLVQEIDLPTVGLNADTGNFIRLHRPIESWRSVLATVLPYTNYWHVKNYTRDENEATGLVTAVPTSLELGLIDYRWAFTKAIASGFSGIITCEQYGGDGLSVSSSNARYIRRLLPSLLAASSTRVAQVSA